jgi:hypothetical protein
MQHKDEILRTWKGLNEYLKTAGESECERLIKLETKGPRNSRTILLRIHSRLNIVRAHRERTELSSKAR